MFKYSMVGDIATDHTAMLPNNVIKFTASFKMGMGLWVGDQDIQYVVVASCLRSSMYNIML